MLPEPLVRTLSDGSSWMLEENYIYELNDGRTLFIPASFLFDYASIPRIAWRLFPPATGKHRIPSLGHDWLCASGNVSWTEAANIFLVLMETAGVSKTKRYMIYFAVRLFGQLHKPDPRKDRLKLLQRVAVEQCIKHYSNVI